MGEVSSPPLDPTASVSLGRAEWETNRFYMPELLDASDLWVWEFILGGGAKTSTFSLEGIDFDAATTAHLEVYLQGGSDAAGVVDHHVRLSLNKDALGEVSFDGNETLPLRGRHPSLPAARPRAGRGSQTSSR